MTNRGLCPWKTGLGKVSGCRKVDTSKALGCAAWDKREGVHNGTKAGVGGVKASGILAAAVVLGDACW